MTIQSCSAVAWAGGKHRASLSMRGVCSVTPRLRSRSEVSLIRCSSASRSATRARISALASAIASAAHPVASMRQCLLTPRCCSEYASTSKEVPECTLLEGVGAVDWVCDCC